MTGFVAHLDADCFYVSAERVRHPEMNGMPVGVLGNNGACVIAKSYEMKASGVKTGTPIWDAARMCPEGVYVKRDFYWYEVLSRTMLAIVGEFTPRLEYYSIDEFFFEALPVSHRTDLPATATKIRDHIREAAGLPVTIGVARTRTLAKLFSDTAKPFGSVAVLTRAHERELLAKLPVTEIDPLEAGGVIALVGPTGAGKTTTIAKLAACFAQRHNARDVALVTTDTVRVGGREQLHGYGRQLGIAVHEADSAQSLALVLERLRDYKLVLIDTAGLGQRDRNLVGQLNWLRASGQVQTLLCLPANSHFSDLDEVVRRFSTVQPQGVVLTKLDETGRLGSALSVVVDHQLPMAWVTDGQRVPDDLHRANSAHLVLRLDQLRREADEPCSTEATHVA